MRRKLSLRAVARGRADVLDEKESATGLQNAVDFVQRQRHIIHGAEHEGGDDGIDAGIFDIELLGMA